MSLLESISKKVADTAKAAAKKSGDIVEVTRLSVNIGTEEEKIKKAYAEIGKIMYEAYSKGEEVGENIKEICSMIDTYEKNIAEMKQKILELRNVKLCPGCNTEIESDMLYCYKCGMKQTTP